LETTSFLGVSSDITNSLSLEWTSTAICFSCSDSRCWLESAGGAAVSAAQPERANANTPAVFQRAELQCDMSFFKAGQFPDLMCDNGYLPIFAFLMASAFWREWFSDGCVSYSLPFPTGGGSPGKTKNPSGGVSFSLNDMAWL